MSLSLNDFDQNLIENIVLNSRGYVRSAARNAIHHLERANIIKEVDPEMAVFRAITAEEESATAIILALKEKGYENANKIKFKKHNYKQALYPFFRAIAKFFADFSMLPSFPFGKNIQLRFENEGKKRKLVLSFHFENGLITATPPLGFEISKNGEKYYFQQELKEITSGESRKEIIKYIDERANRRNQLLYAAPGGIPIVEHDINGFLVNSQDIVLNCFKILSLIFPYKEKAIFVQQALNAYLTMMGEIDLE